MIRKRDSFIVAVAQPLDLVAARTTICTHGSMLNVSGQALTDAEGRQVILKGCSVAGNCKYPANLPTHSPDLDTFYDHRNASFVGRPFPLEEADSHFQRLAQWGMTTLRLIVSWSEHHTLSGLKAWSSHVPETNTRRR